MLYFASGQLDLPGAMFTASHNPARYNGIKLCRAGAVAIGQDTGLAEISARAAGLPRRRRLRSPRDADGRRIEPVDLLGDYAELPALAGRPARRSGRCGSSSTPPTAWAATPCRPCSATRCSTALPLTIVPLYFELDGTFPNHEANPLEPANLVDLQAAVVARAAPTSGSPSTATPIGASSSTRTGSRSRPARSPALIATRELARNPGAAIIHNLITSRAVPEIIAEHGGAAGAHPGRPFAHQGRDGPHRRDLRRRALGPLLLPRLLAGRHRHARGDARAGRARRAGRRRCPS